MTQSIKQELIAHFPHQKMKIDIISGFSKFSGKITSRLKKPVLPYILFVGTFEPRKNLLNTIIGFGKCVLQLKVNNLPIPKLYLVGGKGWQQIKLAYIINKLGLSKYIKIWGYVSDKKLSHLYQNSLFLAYIPFYEGFGLPVIEAITYQKPVLTSNQVTLKEVLGPCGIAVNPKSPDRIATSMYQLTTNQHLRNAYIASTKKWSKSFSPQKSSDQFYQIIKKYNPKTKKS
jgi:glycosyltransferase involved in cell wall biosynthesis